MKKRDTISALFWMGFGAFFTIGGYQAGLMRQGIPGPGSLPFIVGIITMVLSAGVLSAAVKTRLGATKKFLPQEDSLRKLLLATAAIIGYGLILKSVGFMGTTFLFLLFVLALIGKEKWVVSLSFSLLIAVGSYLLFSALQVELPKGIWGI